MKKLFYLFVSGLIILNLFVIQVVFADDFNEGTACVNLVSDNNVYKSPIIGAASAIVIDAKTGRVLFEKNAYSKRSIASTTKIMTAIIALEKGNLNDIVTVSKKAASVGGSTCYLAQGDRLTLKELLYGLMLNSGNDAAVAIAEHISGSVDEFVKLMNRKAKELGAYNTCYKSPHGLDKEGQYCTASDLAIITKYALKNPVFNQIVSTKSTTISIGGLYNTNEMLGIYPGADGVKTGYTGQAGRCLVASATRDNMRLISVVLNCWNRTVRAQSSKNLLDYGFNNYKYYKLIKKGGQIDSLPVIKGVEKRVSVCSDKTIEYPFTDMEIKSIKTKISLPSELKAPVIKGAKIGKIKYELNGKLIDEAPLVISEDIAHKNFIDYIKEIFTSWISSVRYFIN